MNETISHNSEQHWHSEITGETVKDSPQATFVWLHGWGQDHTAFTRLIKLLNTEGRHLNFDQPGFGKTPMLKKGASTKDYADALAEILKRDDHKPYVFIGHSFGCRVSVQMAKYYPDLVKAVIMIAGAGIPRKLSTKASIKRLVIKIIGKFSYWSDRLIGSHRLEDFRAHYGSTDYNRAGELRETFVNVVNENLANSAREMRVPALLIYGSEDSETPPSIGHAYARVIPLARYTELKGFDHYDILDRGAYQVEGHIRQFLKDIDHD